MAAAVDCNCNCTCGKDEGGFGADQYLSMASVFLTVASFLVAVAAFWFPLRQCRQREEEEKQTRLRDWLRELSIAESTAMYELEMFKQRCQQMPGASVNQYFNVFRDHIPVKIGTVSITAEDLARAEQARGRLAGVWDGIKRDHEEGRLPTQTTAAAKSWFSSKPQDQVLQRSFLVRATNYWELVDFIDAANWYRLGINTQLQDGKLKGDYIFLADKRWNDLRPSRFTWVEQQMGQDQRTGDHALAIWGKIHLG